MGGDHGPATVIPGAELALIRHPETRFLLYGEESAVRPLLDQHPRLKAAATFHHTEVAVGMDDKPSQALRRGRHRSSMWLAIEAVKRGDADAAVSAGNTGALMAMARLCLRTLPGVERPVIAALWPTARGESIVLDVGATIGTDAASLVTMAVMGAAMARIVLDLEQPTVGLLNIGVEEVKGLEMVREAGTLLRDAGLPGFVYHGFVEGDDIGQGTTDVVVTEGFVGNIALKTAEGTAKQIAGYLRTALAASLMSRIGYAFARKAFQQLREQLDPRKINGGTFLGLNGLVIKSHGGTDGEGFATAVDLAHDMVQHDLMTRIKDSLAAESGLANRGTKP